MTTKETYKKDLILKIDFHSSETIDKFIGLLKDNIEFKISGKDKYLIKI